MSIDKSSPRPTASANAKTPPPYAQPSSPRGGTTGALPTLAATGGLVVKEKESVLMNMDVAEVQELQARSQRQMTGTQDPGDAPVQKTGQTLKQAIAASQRQASNFVNRMTDAPVYDPSNDYSQQPVLNVSFRIPGPGVAATPPATFTSTPTTEDERHRRPTKQRKKAHRKQTTQKGVPPPPNQPPAEYVDGYDSDESMYAPQFANNNNRSNRMFSLDDSMLQGSQRDMDAAFEQLKTEKGLGHSKKRLVPQMQLGLPDKEGELTEAEFYQKYWIEAGKLGEGSFARVRKITRKHDRRPFALKVIKKAGKSKEDLEALQKEIDILRKFERETKIFFETYKKQKTKLKHKNVVRLTDWVETKKRIHMVVEFCNGGDVFERILKQKTFSEWEASYVVQQVAEGLDHIHSKGIVHRDLKPDNLMYLDTSPKAEIKIIDFGLAGDCSKSSLKTPCGTAHYVAPEVLFGIPYDTQADMWSLGVIIYMLLCGFPPFFDATGNQKRLYQLIKAGKFRFPSPYWDYISDQAKDLIKGLLTKDPKERMSAAQVLAHPWVGGKAVKKEMSDLYMSQMKFFQSSKQFTNVKIGEEEAQTEQKSINIFANQEYAYNYE
ncbi:calcium/calmodulin-dependent protein kinase type 1 (camki) [Reticulomyxa filosa]|uniref:Calcium/calmodulin-dependent protein kinase type 1 (Camki) n=1 Tax=Reticulomyxa filosa TaxID=46433 RepID=X6NFD0_RETFI|nr:calcium/calmodulin-dependent protein kinase type 1 (camki) [Reticulomyxa filosa]|eukprot:ETO24613.1 calcium/calmodulin-dependent protein kinase type 1 (camki) [Reticulomyxa filosa]